MLFMAVTPDEYELPLYVADSCKELADHFGKSNNLVHTCISENRSGKYIGMKFIKVDENENLEEQR